MTRRILCSKGDESGQLHGYSTHSAEKSLRSMAEEMNDYELCAKIGGGDLVALEAKYHTSCLVKYRIKHHSFSRAKCSSCGGSYSELREAN